MDFWLALSRTGWYHHERQRQEKRMPYNPKRRKTMKKGKGKRPMRISPKNRFINQMGGWTQNSKSTERIETIETIGLPQSDNIVFNNGTIGGSIAVKVVPIDENFDLLAIRPAFQYIKPKKVEIFIVGLEVNDGAPQLNTFNMQICVGKWKDGPIRTNLMHNVPGCQLKMFNVPNMYTGARQLTTQGETEVMRCAVFHPPLNAQVQNDPNNPASDAPVALSSNWLDTQYIGGLKPKPYWNAFGISILKIGQFAVQTTVSVHFYLKVTWLCKTRKWSNVGGMGGPGHYFLTDSDKPNDKKDDVIV